jgi:hypothetical protein
MVKRCKYQFISLGRGRGAMMKILNKNTGPDFKQK